MPYACAVCGHEHTPGSLAYTDEDSHLPVCPECLEFGFVREHVEYDDMLWYWPAKHAELLTQYALEEAERAVKGWPAPSCFGRCPRCGNGDGDYLNVRARGRNVGKEHRFVCHQDRVWWPGGHGLFSSWEFEDATIWQRNEDLIRSYTNVEPA